MPCIPVVDREGQQLPSASSPCASSPARRLSASSACFATGVLFVARWAPWRGHSVCSGVWEDDFGVCRTTVGCRGAVRGEPSSHCHPGPPLSSMRHAPCFPVAEFCVSFPRPRCPRATGGHRGPCSQVPSSVSRPYSVTMLLACRDSVRTGGEAAGSGSRGARLPHRVRAPNTVRGAEPCSMELLE